MKKGKKGWIWLMAFTMWTALITGCGKWTGNKPDKMPEDTMVEPIWSISLIRQEEGALVRVEPWDGEEEEFFDYPVAAETLDKARTILENYNVASWAGFRGEDPNALDGYSMRFQAEFVDGSRIEAFGENNFPKNFNEVFSELDDLTVEAKDAFYEEQSSQTRFRG